MSEQELNDFIFFALKEVEKENQKLKTEMKKKDKIIDSIKEYAQQEIDFATEDITKGLVRYSEKYAQYVLVNTGSVKDEFEPLGDYKMEVFEIIGNEFDNPDLLEKGAEE